MSARESCNGVYFHSDEFLVRRFVHVLKRNVSRAAEIHHTVADILPPGWRWIAEVEFIMNACHHVIDVEGGRCEALKEGYLDIDGWFGLYSQSHVKSVAAILYLMADRLPDPLEADEIKVFLKLKHELGEEF